MTEKDIVELIGEDLWMMQVLLYAETLGLQNWMISAGFVRNKVWDKLSGRKVGHSTDIDFIYFDLEGNNEKEDEALTKRLQGETGWRWEVINQVYTHDWNAEAPYKSAEDALAHFPETATAIAVTLKIRTLTLVALLG